MGTKTDAKTQKENYSYSQWMLVWRRLKKHRLAMFAMVVLAFLYFIALFCEFLAPYATEKRFDESNAPPHVVRVFSEERGPQLPFIYGYTKERNMTTLEIEYQVDKDKKFPIKFFVKGSEYRLLGLFKTDIHLFGIKGPGKIFLFGTDQLGRDIFSRVLYGTRISTTIGLISIFFSLTLGLLIGAASALYGGFVDIVVQRAIEVLLCIPSISLWMGLSAALPRNWSALQVYFSITVILALRNWIGVARIVRGKFLSTKEEAFVQAAQSFGATSWRIMVKHLIPNFMTYVIVSVTLSIPRIILAETALSFLGVGLKPPVVSWGVLLQNAQNVHSVAEYPWRLIPGLFVIVTVLAFNFLGDGLRDAADPYKAL